MVDQRKTASMIAKRIAIADCFTVGVQADGKVRFAGLDEYGLQNVQGWTDVVAVAAGGGSAMPAHVVGLKTNGTVVAVGDNNCGQCDTSDWSDIVAVSASDLCTVGLRRDGTLAATGNVFDLEELLAWDNVVEVVCGNMYMTAIQADGKVLISSNGMMQLEYEHADTSELKHTDFIQLSTSIFHIVGVRSNGTAVAIGKNDYCQCNVYDWSDIISIAAGGWHTVGLNIDGKVIAVGRNDNGQCDVYQWRDIIAVSAGWFHTVGVQSSGRVVATGNNKFGQCDVSAWKIV